MHFRGMTPTEDGLPAVGPSARSLGVRPHDVRLDSEDRVLPKQGGMSVTLNRCGIFQTIVDREEWDADPLVPAVIMCS